MRQIVQSLLRLSSIATAVVLPVFSVRAAPVTGMIGVGAWNTQAEFADVKVVKGTETLYESDFASGMPGWTTLGGTWRTQDGYLRQEGSPTPALALVGSATWSDYTLTLRARKTGGSEGFLITFGSPGDGTRTWWNIGGWANTRHALEVAGVSAPPVEGTIETGRWYDIRVQISSRDIRCYLDGSLVHDTARLLDETDRALRFQKLLVSPGFRTLNSEEQQRLRDLAGRSVFPGTATRATFDAMPSNLSFAALSVSDQAAVIRKVNRHRLTWSLGWGYEGIDATRRQTIIDSMDSAVSLYNSLGLFEKHVTANNSPGTPTADANYDGSIRFGGSFNSRVALHEMGHCLGIGTYGRWSELMVNGGWTGPYANAQLSVFDGAGRILNGDAIHFWPYGLNYDSEDSVENRRRHVLIVAAARRDMGIHTFQQTVYTTELANGAYRLSPRHAPTMVLDVMDDNPENGARIDIATRNPSRTTAQRFLLDLQNDGSYRIRTALPGNRCVELPGGVTANGTELRLGDDTNDPAQHWYFIPMGDGWYKIAPRNDITKGMDVAGIATTSGTPVISWEYWDGHGQQWALTLLTPAYGMEDLRRTLAIAGGTLTATRADLGRLDLSGGATAMTVDLSDAMRIARKVAGLDVNP